MTRKYITIAGMVVLLVIAAFVNFRLNHGSDTAQQTVFTQDSLSAQNGQQISVDSGEEDYFAVFRTDRENVRNKELEYLETIILHEKTDAETLADAQRQKIEIVTCMEKEFTVENLLKSKGFSDVAVTFHKGSVNVVLDAETLSQEQVAQILDVVRRETGEPSENIKISTSK